MRRRVRLGLIVGIVLVAVAAGLLAALPSIARRLAVAQISTLTGRDVAVTDLRLNLFTRRLALSGFRLGDSGGRPAFVELERLEARFRILPLLRGRLHLDALALTRPVVRVVRLGPSEFNFTELLARFSGGPPSKDPAHVTLARLTLEDGAVLVEDRVVSPVVTWEARGLSVELHDIETVSDRTNGTASVKVTLAGTPITVSAAELRLRPLHARATVDVAGLDLARLRPYIPANAPVALERGRFTTRLALRYDAAAGVHAGGDVTIDDLVLGRAGQTVPFVVTPRLAMTSRDVVYRDGVVTAAHLQLDGAPSVTDASVSPARRVDLRGLTVAVDDASWPVRAPARLRVAAQLPVAGSLDAEGTFAFDTRALALKVKAADVTLAPYAAFLPIDAAIGGRLDAALQVEGAFDDKMEITVKGGTSVRTLTVGPAGNAPVRVERVAVTGVDARWPTRARVARVLIVKPSILLERDASGAFPLRAMLTPRGATPPATPAAVPAPASAPSPAPGPRPATAGGLAFEVGELIVDNGEARFVDNSTAPFYSEEITRLALTLRGLGNTPDKHAALAVDGVIGGTGALNLKGEVAPFGRPFFVDVAGELRDISIPRANPYLRHFADWFARSGRLTTKIHYRVVDDALEATNDIVVQQLRVEREKASAEAARKVGLPLGLAVAILKDARGDIRLPVPIAGKLSAPEFSFGEAIAATIKNLVVKLVTAPFRAIGSIFQKSEDTVDEVKIDPVPFEAGSASATSYTEARVQRVADFLRATPYVKLAINPVVTPSDVAALKSQEVAARIQRVQREAKLADFGEAAARTFRMQHPDRPPPKVTEEIVAALRDEQALPEEATAQLASRRLALTRKLLIDAAGIEPARLVAGSTPPTGATGDGRVEFELQDSEDSQP